MSILIHRFSTEKYNMMYLDNKFSHLTNTSLNKLGPAYFVEKERIGAGWYQHTRAISTNTIDRVSGWTKNRHAADAKKSNKIV